MGISLHTKVTGAHTLGMLPKPIAPFLSISICSSRLSQVVFLLGKAREPAALAKALGQTLPSSRVLPLWLNFPPLGESYWF